ncbi:MAG TPA: enoyl-CoA hydratase-related protein [Acidimicrobiales bacterium]|nr:enoyl-CoA hydratase-related protein [Acidimicrobiales bacterium]
MTDRAKYVAYERQGKVSTITLDRAPINVYDGAFHAEFQGAWQEAKRDTQTTVVVMKATGKHFCAGANLRNPEPAPEGAQVLDAWEEVRLIRDLMKPTIAAVQGGCIGGGQRMVFPCDLIFCSQDAFFRDPTATMGVGGIQSHLHTWLYGPRLAKEMIYSGMRLPAERLYNMGEINRLYPDAETLHRETMAFAHEIAEQDPLALRQAKRASNITMDIMGQHYILSRMQELLDDAPKMNLGIQTTDQIERTGSIEVTG